MSSPITFRRYTQHDLEAALALKAEQDKLLGQPMDFCDLTEHPVLLAEVAESEGEIIGLHTLEAVPEYCVFSRDPRFTAAAIKRAPRIASLLQEYGFRWIRCAVPQWIGDDCETIVEALGHAGFAPHNGCRHMMLDLRPKSYS
jgi:hypothetical protein